MPFDLASARPVGQKENLSAKDVVSEAIKNFPSSFKNIVTGTYEAVTNPLQTGKAMLDIGAGAFANRYEPILPESILNAIGEDKREIANQVGQMYVQRYGGIEQAKRTIANDPAGFMSDLSAVLTTGGGVVPQLGKAASFVDPLSLAAKTVGTVGKAAAPILGMTTGAGSEAIRQAYGAGKAGGTAAEQFRGNISGTAPMTDVLDMAKQNLAKMNEEKQKQYRSGMVNIKNDKSILDFSGIDTAVSNAQARTQFKGVVTKKQAAEKIDEVKTLINDWKALDPVEYHTPEGLDALKQQVGNVLETIPYEQKNARASVKVVYDSIKSEINKQAPTYANVMKEYSTTSELIREIEGALSLGQKSRADTSIRKLQSLMRKNVNTNFGQRVQLGKELSKYGEDIFPALAGQSLAELTPMGLQRATSLPTALGAFSAGGGTSGIGIPLAAASLLSSSPRLMGEAAYGAGLIGRGVSAAENAIPLAFDPRAYNLMYQAGRIKGQ
jgi:hypothetical protein